MRFNKEKHNMKYWEKWLLSMPVGLVLAVLPLIIGRVDVRTYTENETWLPDSLTESDFFLYGKMLTLSICCFLMIFLFVRYMWRERLTGRWYFLFLAGYGILVFVSALASEHVWLSLRGISGSLQGAMVVIAYLIVFFYSFFWAKSGGNFHCLCFILGIGMGILGLIGISQLFGFDFLSCGFVKEWLGGKTATVTHRIYLTLYHWNYAGHYVTLMLPISVAMLFYYHNRKKKKAMVIWFVLFYLLILCLFGSQSRTGTLAVLLSFMAAGWIYRRRIRKYKLPIGIVTLSVAFIGLFCNFYITGDWFGKWQQIHFHTKGSKSLSSIVTEKERVKIKYKGKMISFQIKGEGKEIHIKKTPEKTWPKAITFEKVEIMDGKETIYGYQMNFKKSKWRFTNQHGDGACYYINVNGKFDSCIRAETALPSWINEVASLRGFVWSRTIPLLQQYPIWGAGSDQFGFAFPHQDYAARYRYDLLGTYYKKPHNWYLQMGVESGCLSLVFMILFLVWYLKKNYRCDEGNVTTQKEYIRRAIWISVVAYMISSLFNDSFLTVAPVFWCLAGMGAY